MTHSQVQDLCLLQVGSTPGHTGLGSQVLTAAIIGLLDTTGSAAAATSAGL